MNHKFRDYSPSSCTEILFLGTFHPDIDNGTDFFYGRPRNYFWQLLPLTFGQVNLKHEPLHKKIGFLHRNKIDLQDIILTLDNVPIGQEANYDDEFIDPLVSQWFDTINLIASLANLKEVYFTRKTFQNIPNILDRIVQIRNHCIQNNIRFCCIETPSRFINQNKITQWSNSIILQNECLFV